jgi:hypothetical protein
LLKAPMTRLIRRIPDGQIVPRGAGPQYPEDPIQHGSRIGRWAPATIGASTMTERRREDLPLRVSQVHAAEYDDRGSGVPNAFHYF